MFFHTCNDLYDARKQIVVSSDSTPKEIEGSLTRLIAFGSLGGRAMTVDLAQDVLSSLWAEDEKTIIIEHIQEKAAELFGLRLADGFC